jgi:hypothetical protein
MTVTTPRPTPGSLPAHERTPVGRRSPNCYPRDGLDADRRRGPVLNGAARARTRVRAASLSDSSEKRVTVRRGRANEWRAALVSLSI